MAPPAMNDVLRMGTARISITARATDTTTKMLSKTRKTTPSGRRNRISRAVATVV